jgi:hypothetical protein
MKVRPWGEGQGEYVEINVSDFDEAVHTPFAGATEGGATKARAKAAKKAEAPAE